MPSHILVPVDGSAESRLALTHALARFPAEHITVLHVIEPFPDHTKAGGHPGERVQRIFNRGQQLLDEMLEQADGYTGTVTTELVYGRPVHAIPRYAETHGIDEVVVGSRGRDGAARLLLGSVAETVVRRVPTPVTVVRPTSDDDEDGFSPPEQVLVPFDRSFCSRNALEYTFEQFPDAAVTALYVTSPLSATYEPIDGEDDLNDVLVDDEETHDVFEMAQGIGDRYERDIETATGEGEPSKGILDWIEQNDVDHVVIGCHGRDGVARWVLGSVAEFVVRRAPVPVTAVK